MGNDIEAESTIGIWIGEDDVRDIERFDEHFRRTDGQYSRSAEIKRAMRVHLAVQQALDSVGADIPSREVESLLRALIREEFDE